MPLIFIHSVHIVIDKIFLLKKAQILPSLQRLYSWLSPNLDRLGEDECLFFSDCARSKSCFLSIPLFSFLSRTPECGLAEVMNEV